ncbi:hypothetical protein MATL_G00087240 [Megalops atlanticus]|uniref:Shadow of prion protein n=1 Tax=Megalops atlanticus TaxID=7932 RepID=A0A9D3T7G2_MEGAT|nr:hypothetical protein MATL_G00087240 [Megalops atlanticus]
MTTAATSTEGSSRVMIGQRRLLLLWACMLFMATLCPCALSRRGGGARGRGKGVGLGAKAPPSHSRGSSKQGLKLAGAAAAGALGGAALGYGLGSLGRPRYGYGYGYDDSSEEDRRFYYGDGMGFRNHSDWRYQRGSSSSGPTPCVAVVLGSAASTLLGNWIRGI